MPGVTLTLALYSMDTGKSVRKNLVITGELSLTGKILPIGGIKEKTIAARKVGVKELIIPADNKMDFEDLPEYIRQGIIVRYADYFENVIDYVYNNKG